MVRALTEGVPLVRAEAEVIHAGRQVVTAEGRLVGPDAKLYAHATTTQGAIRLGYGRIEIKSSALLERLGSAG
jgi:hypothetical protein